MASSDEILRENQRRNAATIAEIERQRQQAQQQERDRVEADWARWRNQNPNAGG